VTWKPNTFGVMLRHCVFCGHSFIVHPNGQHKLYCSVNCGWKQRRAIQMLAGTHGHVNNRWQRLSP